MSVIRRSGIAEVESRSSIASGPDAAVITS
jgi:hypothetical protein